MLGDMHYSGHFDFTAEEFKYAIHEQMKSPKIRAIYSQIPFIYLIDDHDIGKNNADGTHASTFESTKAYKEIVPGDV